MGSHNDFINGIVAGSNYGVLVIISSACDLNSKDSCGSQGINAVFEYADYIFTIILSSDHRSSPTCSREAWNVFFCKETDEAEHKEGRNEEEEEVIFPDNIIPNQNNDISND